MDLKPFSENVRTLFSKMDPCTICPRNCRVNRCKGDLGFCGIGEMPLLSSAGPHFGEESVLVGTGGSGTIFFAGCNLGCIFCQNFDISHLRYGTKVTVERLSDVMLDLQTSGCININFVTPTHVIATIAAALESARKKGLTLPTVYNTGGYDSVETLRLLAGLIDIYMPDAKYADPAVAKKLSNAPDYPEINRLALKEMHSQVGDLKIENGIAAKGLLIRHLVLPENLAGSFETIDFLADQISPDTAVNVMDQYRPCYKADQNPQINRRPTPQEIRAVEKYTAEKGLRLIT